MAIVRVSAGVYRDDATGKTVNATTSAAAAAALAPKPKAAAPKPTAPTAPAPKATAPAAAPPVRLSPGVYQTASGQTVQAPTAAAAAKQAAPKATTSAAPTAKPTERVLGTKQRAKFEEIRKTQGAEAAAAFRQGIAAKKNITLPTKPGGTGMLSDPTKIGKKEASKIAFTSEGEDYVAGHFDPQEGLDRDQNQAVEQSEARNIALGQIAEGSVQDIANAFQDQPDWSSMPQLPTGQENDRQAYEQRVYENYMRTAQPEFDRQMQEFQQQMADQGIPVGSQLYNQQAEEMRRYQDTQRQNIRTQAMQESGAEWERSFNIGTQGAQNAVNMALLKRNLPAQDLSTLQGLMQGTEEDKQLARELVLQKLKNQGQLDAVRAGRGGGGGGRGGGGQVAVAPDGTTYNPSMKDMIIAQIIGGAAPALGQEAGGMLGGFVGGMFGGS